MQWLFLGLIRHACAVRRGARGMTIPQKQRTRRSSAICCNLPDEPTACPTYARDACRFTTHTRRTTTPRTRPRIPSRRLTPPCCPETDSRHNSNRQGTRFLERGSRGGRRHGWSRARSCARASAAVAYIIVLGSRHRQSITGAGVVYLLRGHFLQTRYLRLRSATHHRTITLPTLRMYKDTRSSAGLSQPKP